MVKVTTQQHKPPTPHFIHPQIQNSCAYRNHSQSSLSHLPVGLSSSKSLSVNDFTGSILAADRTNYYNKQNAAAAAAAAAKMNQNIIDASEPLYTNVVRKENSASDLSRYIRSGSANPTDGYIYHQAARNHQRVLNSFTSQTTKVDQAISIEFEKTRSFSTPHNNNEEVVKSSSRPTQIPVPRLSLNKSNTSSSATLSEHVSKKDGSPKSRTKKTSDEANYCLSDSTDSVSSVSSGSAKPGLADNAQTEDEIVKRLAELEGINRKNIEQLKKLEQDYSAATAQQEIPISIRLADGKRMMRDYKTYCLN
jgi:hypothetical protein